MHVVPALCLGTHSGIERCSSGLSPTRVIYAVEGEQTKSRMLKSDYACSMPDGSTHGHQTEDCLQA